jgi:hypothetical protein
MRASRIALFTLSAFPCPTIGFSASSLETNRLFKDRTRLSAESDDDYAESIGRGLISEGMEKIMDDTNDFVSTETSLTTVVIAEGDGEEIMDGTSILPSSETSSATVLIAEGNNEIIEDANTLGSSETVSATAEAATGAGIAASKAVPFLAPVAALVAGRQALIKRDVLREQEAITAKDLNRIQKDLANADTTISVRLCVTNLRFFCITCTVLITRWICF